MVNCSLSLEFYFWKLSEVYLKLSYFRDNLYLLLPHPRALPVWYQYKIIFSTWGFHFCPSAVLCQLSRSSAYKLQNYTRARSGSKFLVVNLVGHFANIFSHSVNYLFIFIYGFLAVLVVIPIPYPPFSTSRLRNSVSDSFYCSLWGGS